MGFQPALDAAAREAPLAAHLDSRNASIVGHTIDRGAVDVENLLELAGGEEIGHECEPGPDCVFSLRLLCHLMHLVAFDASGCIIRLLESSCTGT